MARENRSGQGAERILIGQRLMERHVETNGTNPAVSDGTRKSHLINKRATRRVDDHDPRSHGAQRPLIDHHGTAGCVKRDRVGSRDYLVKRHDPDAVVHAPQLEQWITSDDFTEDAARFPSESAADAAKPDYAQGRGGQRRK
ncbi:MAG: hypothetical protein RJQ01_01250 [Microcella sp.]